MQAQHKNTLVRSPSCGSTDDRGSKWKELNARVPRGSVGFEPEVRSEIRPDALHITYYSHSTTTCSVCTQIYQGGEDGFRVHRNDDGSPMKAPIEVQVKSKDEMGM